MNSVDLGGTLTGSPGVLANDHDPKGHPLTAELLSDVSHGTLTFVKSDGTFTYIPKSNFKGIDRFTYKAHNGLFYSGAATVRIAVGPMGTAPVLSDLSLSPTLLPVPREHEKFTLSFVFNFSDPDMDIQSLNISLTGPSGIVQARYEELLSQQPTGTGGRQFVIDSSFIPGVYQIKLEILDLIGNSSGIQSVIFTIDPLAQRFLEITGVQPLSGRPGDKVLINGRGFESDSLSDRVYFSSNNRANPF